MNKKLIEQYKLLYEIKPTYGASSQKIFDKVLEVIKEYNPKSILDYGCGRSALIDMIYASTNIAVYRYDPVFAEYNKLPTTKVDFVICTDVLQHIPENELDENLKEIASAGDVCYFKIKCCDHPTTFPNGEPTNCTVHDKYWWNNILKKFYKSIKELQCNDDTSVVFVAKSKLCYKCDTAT